MRKLKILTFLDRWFENWFWKCPEVDIYFFRETYGSISCRLFYTTSNVFCSWYELEIISLILDAGFRWTTLSGKIKLHPNKEFGRLCGLVVRDPGYRLQIQRSRVRFQALPDFLRSSGSGTGSTQPREDTWGATWKESSGSGLENRN
jgi:hypothetical protein